MMHIVLKVLLVMGLTVFVIGFSLGAVLCASLCWLEGATPLLVFILIACFVASCMSVEIIRKELDL